VHGEDDSIEIRAKGYMLITSEVPGGEDVIGVVLHFVSSEEERLVHNADHSSRRGKCTDLIVIEVALVPMGFVDASMGDDGGNFFRENVNDIEETGGRNMGKVQNEAISNAFLNNNFSISG